MNLRKRPPVIHPLLFAVFPILFLYAQNATIIRPTEVVIPVLVAGGAAILLTAACALVARNTKKGAVIATSSIFLFLSYGHFTRALPEFELVLGESLIGPSFVVLASSALVLLTIVIVTLRTRRNLDHITVILNWIGAALIAVEILHGGFALATRQDSGQVDRGQVTAVESTGYRPDIYYIIVDGYARSDVLNGIYGYDNSSLLTKLKDLGFFVADSSFANYPQTILSLASSLNMDFVENLGQFERSSGDLVPLKNRLQQNALAAFLKRLGYTSVVFASGFGPTEIRADRVISPGWFHKEMPSLILALTPLATIFSGLDSPLDRHRRRILYALDRFSDLSDIRSPKFVFAHILSPHAPFVFDADGNEVQYQEYLSLADGVTMIKDSSDAEKYRQRFRDQTTFITRKLTETLTELVSSSADRPPVVILQSDHGPASGLQWEDWTVSNLRERFGILNAYNLPGVDDSVLYDEISPVNSFRVVLNEYFGTDFELLADRHEFASMKYPLALQSISKHLGRNAYDHLMEQYLGRPPDSVSADDVSEPVEGGTGFIATGYRPVTERGLLIKLDSMVFSSQCEISIDRNDSYEVRYRQDTIIVGVDHIPPREGRAGTLKVERRTIPAAARRRGFDNVLIIPSGGDYVYGFGHIVFY